MASKKPNERKDAILTSGDSEEFFFHKRKNQWFIRLQSLPDYSLEFIRNPTKKGLLIDLDLEQVKIGSRPIKGFKAEDWKSIINVFLRKKLAELMMRPNSRTCMYGKLMASMEKANN